MVRETMGKAGAGVIGNYKMAFDIYPLEDYDNLE